MHTNLPHSMRWLCGCLIFFIGSCSNSTGYNKLVISAADSLVTLQKIQRAKDSIVQRLKPLIRNGDLVVRIGNDFTSESLSSLNQRDKSWSHCGIASIENDSVFVYHALGGDWNPDQKIRRDPVEYFGEPEGNRGIGLYRYRINEELIPALMDTVKKYYSKGVMFDMKFDLVTDDRMYCAEFVYKSYSRGTNRVLQFSLSHIGKFTFIGVDDLFLQPLCGLQKRFFYR